ncbi:MAG: carboxypeptidase regulatory-like domain-containing protein [Gemmatimonadaceae bacterium]
MRRYSAFLTAVFASPVGLAAHAHPPPTGDVLGSVVDVRGPVAGAEVRLARRGTANVLMAITERTGTFEFRSVEAGVWTLTVRRVGYKVHTQDVAVREGQPNVMRVTLTAAPHALDTIAVVREGLTPARYGPSSRMDEFYRRRARARGRVFTREDIEASGRARLTDLLRLVPGARVKTFPGNLAEVHFTRCSGPVRLARSGSLTAVATGTTGGATPSVALYVNSVRIDPESVRETIAELSLSEIEAIEVYRGVSELPPEAMGDACAAIFIWTRFGPGEAGPPPNQ